MKIDVYSEDQRDCLQEICNVAMGQAGDALARHVGIFVTLSIPAIKILDVSEFTSSLDNYKASDHVYAAAQLFDSAHRDSGLSGLGLLVLSEESLSDLRALSPGGYSDQELIVGTCLKLSQTCLDALSEQWALGFECQPPQIITSDSLDGVCQSLTAGWQRLLVVEINFQLEGHQFNGDLLLLFPDGAISAMGHRLDELLA